MASINCASDAVAITCIGAGQTHQGISALYRGNGIQCTSNAFIASLQSVVKKREVFNVSEIDNILRIGDNLYMEVEPTLAPHIYLRYLAPEDLPTKVRVGKNIIECSVDWINNGLYQNNKDNESDCITSLCEILRNAVFNMDHDDNKDSVLFVGGGYTVSFWRYNGQFYLFNSHAVSETNESDSSGVARLFKLTSLEYLAAALIRYNPEYGGQFSLNRVRVVSVLPVSETNFSSRVVQPINMSFQSAVEVTAPNTNAEEMPISNVCVPTVPEVVVDQSYDNKTTRTSSMTKAGVDIHSDFKLTHLKPVVALDKIEDFKLDLLVPVVIIENKRSKIVSQSKPGRPKKQKRGKKTTKHITHTEATQRYNIKNPQVHRDAVRKYDDTHPDIKKESVARYNATSRNVDKPLRKSPNLIGEKRGDDLKNVKPFSLKKPSLNAISDIYVCPHCSTRLFEEERQRKMWCCGSGSNNVQNLKPLDERFYSELSFIERPRAYNNLFAFSALGVSHGYQQPQGLSFLKIQGRVYHRVFDLGYQQSVNNLGLYINDSSERESLAAKQSLNVDVIRSINTYLNNVNPYIRCFKKLNEEASDEAFIQFQKTSRATHGNVLGDLPLGREVSAVICTERDQYVPRCIAVWKVGDCKPHTVDIMHPLYESFQFPLLYPEGNVGWHLERVDKKGKKLSQARYVRCLLLSEDRFSKFGRLSEEWLVDMFCRISEERLRFFQFQQTRAAVSQQNLRTATYNELLRKDETIAAEGIAPGRIYLPYSFTGGPRYIKVKYLDCIAIVNRLGPPSYFITFTCNPNWPEIRQSLPQWPRQSTNPLICARVFNLRLAELIRDLRSGIWFGKVEYLMYVIEFQKRGLPHAHICFRVEGGGPADNVEIDKFCRADIPDVSEADGRLQKAVLNHMIHGPCGPNRDNLPCYDKDKKMCTKRFPKKDTEVTFSDDRGFVHLRRNSRNEAFIIYRGTEIKVSDLFVVPYNASLLLKYDAHINVEISSLRSIIKYLFKYMTKGPDEARVAIVEDEDRNEIEEYVTKRYIGSSDAAWRVLEFDVTSRSPNVKQLSVHLENQQTVVFRTGNIEEAVNRSTSDLMTYMNRPSGAEFDRMTYIEFYEKYIVHSKRPTTKNVTIYECANGKFITPRQRGELVGRLYFIAPNKGELYYLRILLNCFPCRSYDDLRRLGGPDCQSYQEAARVQGLANDEQEYVSAMNEASTFFTGPRLRRFFVLLAVNGAPVATMWESFKDKICEDVIDRNPQDKDNAYKTCLLQIGRMLLKHGSSLQNQGLPNVEDKTTELSRERDGYDVAEERAVVADWLPKLSGEQRAIYDYIDKLCTDKQFRESNTCAIFIDGPAGTGKTTILNAITGHVRGDLKGIVLTTASSAIAGQNYKGGVTAHSMFRFPIDIDDDLRTWNISNGSQRAELIYHADVIIYDEAPMAHKYLIHMLDRSLQDLMKTKKIFGGKIIIFAGDFRQIPPVVPDARTNSDIYNSSVKSSFLWQNLKKFSLLSSQRCRDDVEYARFLLKLGSNELPQQAIQMGGCVQNLICLESVEYVTELNDLIDFVFPFLDIGEPEGCSHRAILCTRNDSVRAINAAILERLPGAMVNLYANDKIESESADELYFGVDFLNRLQPQGLPEFNLRLKEGCVCMIIRNLSFADGLINGTKVIVESISSRLITVRKPGTHDSYMIPRILFKAPIERNSPYEMSRKQFPLQICYAMTIHKSQGQTIGRVGVDLRSDVFSHGQMYVALGRVRKKNEIKVLVRPERVINNKVFVKNVVIPELIR